jgi:hypothetical protein
MSKSRYNKYVVNYFLANAGGQYQGTWPWPNGLNKKNLIAKKDSGIYMHQKVVASCHLTILCRIQHHGHTQ